MKECERYDSNVLNVFYGELFSTDFRNYDSPTQNSKTDSLYEFETFEEWLDYLIECFVADVGMSKDLVLSEMSTHPEFVSDMRSEYEDLKELCDEE